MRMSGFGIFLLGVVVGALSGGTIGCLIIAAFAASKRADSLELRAFELAAYEASLVPTDSPGLTHDIEYRRSSKGDCG
jgi:hypothetical protein